MGGDNGNWPSGVGRVFIAGELCIPGEGTTTEKHGKSQGSGKQRNIPGSRIREQ